LAINLRRRTPWEAMDLGFTMLRRWWGPVYAAHALVFLPLNVAVFIACWASDMLWLAMLVIWWLEPLYDRVVLHVLARAVFGEVASIGFLKRPSEYTAGLLWALTFERFDLARSFNLPVQLEGTAGRAPHAHGAARPKDAQLRRLADGGVGAFRGAAHVVRRRARRAPAARTGRARARRRGVVLHQPVRDAAARLARRRPGVRGGDLRA
jgi:hypothetical protein